MNTSTYQNWGRIPSPIQPRKHPAQVMREKVLDIHDKKNPIRKEMKKCLGVHNLTAEIEEDTQTLATMKHVEGIIGFICTLRKDGRVISQGRGTAVMNPATRYVSRAVHTAFNSALADAAIRATKVLGTFLNPEPSRTDTAVGEAYRAKEADVFELATDKQRDYLQQLIQINCDEEERERRQSQLGELTKSEASRMIESFRR